MKSRLMMQILLMLVPVLLVPSLSAQCTVASLNGTYTFKASGDIGGDGGGGGNFVNINGGGKAIISIIQNAFGGGGGAVSFAAAGRLVFNGAGGLTITDTTNINGQIMRFYTHAGKYTVDPDCKGNFTMFSFAGLLVVDFDFFIDGINKFKFVSTGMPITGEANK